MPCLSACHACLTGPSCVPSALDGPPVSGAFAAKLRRDQGAVNQQAEQQQQQKAMQGRRQDARDAPARGTRVGPGGAAAGACATHALDDRGPALPGLQVTTGVSMGPLVIRQLQVQQGSFEALQQFILTWQVY